ncbi:aspartate ammonia-lyase [Halarsenatibacter silvermanii]|uniref:aspartate ammonia-lyase n=1 Tax=Halarsenatibacter silvermanii TaxID=321763 RepID=A0A1G9KQ84_9FIRM|nr:aspartate ammonia-lyase [Halarsenatibacter silvermanii]SDL51734.1 aspartate ammonia-lyase [Halarsenatibacter silvermanii]
MRQEKDLLGEKKIREEAYHGIHTARAAENFSLTGRQVNPELIRAIAAIKQAAAIVNHDLGDLSREKKEAVVQACEEIRRDELEEEFILDALQGGAGTSTNMMINEVIANRAIEILGGQKGEYDLVHPNNDVNKAQSTNDVYPTALRIAGLRLLPWLTEEVSRLQETLQEKEREFADILKLGRTQLQDAVPVTLGQEFSAYAEAISRDRWRIYKVKERLKKVNLGGTAVGTGLNAPRKYIFNVIRELRNITGLGLAHAENMIDNTQNLDVFVEISGLLKTLAVDLNKLADDLRLLSSGPRGGLGEIELPQVQAGSSIMPGKINPVIPEAVNQAAFTVISNDQAITLAAQSGQLELNAMIPLLADKLLDNIQILKRTVKMFRKKCIGGIEANREQCETLLEESMSLLTALNPHIGYELTTEIAREVKSTDKNVRDVVLEKDIFTEEKLNEILSPENMTRPGISGTVDFK